MYLIPPDGSGGKVSFPDGTDGIQMAILQMARGHLHNPGCGPFRSLQVLLLLLFGLWVIAVRKYKCTVDLTQSTGASRV